MQRKGVWICLCRRRRGTVSNKSFHPHDTASSAHRMTALDGVITHYTPQVERSDNFADEVRSADHVSRLSDFCQRLRTNGFVRGGITEVLAILVKRSTSVGSAPPWSATLLEAVGKRTKTECCLRGTLAVAFSCQDSIMRCGLLVRGVVWSRGGWIE